MPPDIVVEPGGADPEAPDILSEADYLAAYCRRVDRPLVSEADYAFNVFRLAAIFHGIKGHVARGTAASAHAQERAASFPRLVRLARHSMAACL